jgi:hypothetical protein
MKRTVPLILTAVGGFVLIGAYFIPYTQNWGEVAAIWFDLLAAVAFILGGGNLLKQNLKRVSDRTRGWGYSAIVVVAFLFTLAVGLGKAGVNPSPQFTDYAWSGQYRQIGSAFWYLFQYTFTPLTATMFSLLAFYTSRRRRFAPSAPRISRRRCCWAPRSSSCWDARSLAWR